MRGKILDEARDIINGERADMYGNPEDSFSMIADLWDSYLGKIEGEDHGVLHPKDVAIMMALLKIARETYQHKRDNLADAIGYLALAADMDEK
jgi:hypothetical protein